MYGEGISKLGEIIDLGVKAGIIEKSGSWFSYNSTRIGQGRENVRDFLKANPDMADAIEDKVRKSTTKIADELAGHARARRGPGPGRLGSTPLIPATRGIEVRGGIFAARGARRPRSTLSRR